MEDRVSIHFLAPKQNFMKTVGNPHFLFFPFLKAMSTRRTGKISLYNFVNKIGGCSSYGSRAYFESVFWAGC